MADIVKILTQLKSKKKGQYYENINELAQKEYNLVNEEVDEMISAAESNGVIKRYNVNNKVSFRLVKDNVFIADENCNDDTDIEHSSHVSENSTPHEFDFSSFHSDFTEFKKYVFDEIHALKEIVSSCTQSSGPLHGHIAASHDYLAINCLKDHIKSLENQLLEKQRTIEYLLGRKPIKEVKNVQNIDYNKKADSQIKTLGVNQKTAKSPSRKSVSENKNHAQSKKNVIIIGDSMLNGINEKGFKHNKVKVRAHPGATSEDLYHFIKPSVHKKPDIIILHAGTNDIPNDLKTIDNIKKIDDYIKVNSPATKLVISNIITRNDKNGYREKVTKMNERISKFCEKNGIGMVDNVNIDAACLGAQKLHMNKKGNSYLANNVIKFLSEY